MGYYLQESEKALLLFAIHITTLKELEVWNKSFAWTDISVNANREMLDQSKEGMFQRQTVSG